ncbi:alpha-D-ribose 1-methylphosphonate 5-triphosphate diphosphatase [Fodinicurvata halophila]|uniref:Alpha-D-ribose 1-methylphosphonate 5-triphosphate diphosphatase n=2 Tax=Fodinicurvata halophila TaxID=1419723 RepID=A0ABV8UM24_9PROT
MNETILTNARIVTEDEVFEGSLSLRDGRIAALDHGPSRAPGAEDLEGDYLIPGLVELHTDSLEKHMVPRPGTRWPTLPAIAAHDAQITASGITTVFDAIALGDVKEDSQRLELLQDTLSGLEAAPRHGLFKADHYLHLRCEVSYPGLIEMTEHSFEHAMLRLVSVMDHTPGQRQFVRLDKYAEYYQGKYGLSDTELQDFIARRKADQERHSARNRRHVVALARARGIPLASHDDATGAHVDEAARDGMVIAEFPTTRDAAETSRKAGLSVMMGGPNLVRGGSHSGNVSARDLADDGMLDIISSDYVPSSLLQGAFMLSDGDSALSLPEAVAKVSVIPARRVGLDDRGAIAPAKRADLVRVQVRHGLQRPLAVWREGQRVG